MRKRSKALLVIFIILILISIGEIGYHFFYQSSPKQLKEIETSSTIKDTTSSNDSSIALKFDNTGGSETAYMIQPIFGSFTGVKKDIQIDVSMNIQTNDKAPESSTTGLRLENEEGENSKNLRRLSLIYFNKGKNQGWFLVYQKGTNTVMFEKLPYFDRKGRFRLKVRADGQGAVILLPNGEEKSFILEDSLYGVGGLVKLTTQIGPLSELRIFDLSLKLEL